MSGSDQCVASPCKLHLDRGKDDQARMDKLAVSDDDAGSRSSRYTTIVKVTQYE